MYTLRYVKALWWICNLFNSFTEGFYQLSLHMCESECVVKVFPITSYFLHDLPGPSFRSQHTHTHKHTENFLLRWNAKPSCFMFFHGIMYPHHNVRSTYVHFLFQPLDSTQFFLLFYFAYRMTFCEKKTYTKCLYDF